MNTDESTIIVNELPVKVVRKKIKNLHLAVYPPDGRVRIAVPETVDDKAVQLAVLSKFGWIQRRIQAFADQPRQSARELITGESHYYLGRRYLLDVAYTEKRPFIEIRNKKTLALHIGEGTGLERREKLLVDWYRTEIKRLLPGIVKKWEIRSGLCVNSYGIKRMKTRWGSCNSLHKRIWLNLELIKKPVHCLEYVVVHEMVHFLERTHNDRFLFHMDRIMPQWRTFRDSLNRSPLAPENWK